MPARYKPIRFLKSGLSSITLWGDRLASDFACIDVYGLSCAARGESRGDSICGSLWLGASPMIRGDDCGEAFGLTRVLAGPGKCDGVWKPRGPRLHPMARPEGGSLKRRFG